MKKPHILIGLLATVGATKSTAQLTAEVAVFEYGSGYEAQWTGVPATSRPTPRSRI